MILLKIRQLMQIVRRKYLIILFVNKMLHFVNSVNLLVGAVTAENFEDEELFL